MSTGFTLVFLFGLTLGLGIGYLAGRGVFKGPKR